MQLPNKVYPAAALFLFHLKVGIILSLCFLVPVVAILFGLLDFVQLSLSVFRKKLWMLWPVELLFHIICSFLKIEIDSLGFTFSHHHSLSIKRNFNFGCHTYKFFAPGNIRVKEEKNLIIDQ